MPLENSELISLKLATAEKTGRGSKGLLTYRVLCDLDRQNIAFALVANVGGGWFSREIVPIARIEAMLSMDEGELSPISIKALKAVFISRSANNAGFLVALLLAEGLLELTDGIPKRYAVSENWDSWKSDVLTAQGEAFVLTPKTGPVSNVNGSVQGEAKSKRKRGKKGQSAGIPDSSGADISATIEEGVRTDVGLPDEDASIKDGFSDAASE